MNYKLLVLALLALSAGHVASLDTENIVGGEIAQSKDYPYLVSLQVNEKHICGAALIDVDVVLTAAHCINPDGGIPRIENYKVVSGKSDLKKSKEGETVNVKTIYIHNKFFLKKKPFLIQENDVAVLKLASKISGKVIKLSKKKDTFVGRKLNFAGYGRSQKDLPSDGQLRYLSLEVIDNSKCSFSTPKTLCTGKTGTVAKERGPCNGDSGSPLVADDEVIGIGSSSSCNELRPSIYTRVESYAAFIEGAKSGNPIKEDTSTIHLPY